MGKLSEGVECSRTTALFSYEMQSLFDFLQFWALSEAYIVVDLELSRLKVSVLDCCLDPVNALLFVAWDCLGEGSLNLQLAKSIAGVIGIN